MFAWVVLLENMRETRRMASRRDGSLIEARLKDYRRLKNGFIAAKPRTVGQRICFSRDITTFDFFTTMDKQVNEELKILNEEKHRVDVLLSRSISSAFSSVSKYIKAFISFILNRNKIQNITKNFGRICVLLMKMEIVSFQIILLDLFLTHLTHSFHVDYVDI